jgi:DNA-binding transcriptional regulator YiaG
MQTLAKKSLRKLLVSPPVRPRSEKTAPLTPEQLLTMLEEAEGDKRKRQLAQLVRQARTDAGMSQVDLSEALGLHRNTVQNWELRKGSPELYFREIEEAVGKPAGWFEYQLDPYSRIVDMAGRLDSIDGRIEELVRLVKKLL